MPPGLLVALSQVLAQVLAQVDAEVDPVLPADVEGAALTSPEGDDRVSLDVSGVLGLNAIWYGHRNAMGDGVDTDVAAVFFDARFGDALRLHVEADLDGEDTRHNLGEAYLEADFGRTHHLRAGLMRVPLASEFSTRPEDLPLVGYSFTSGLASRTDWGLRVDGRMHENVWYAVTATAGEGYGLEGHRRRGDQLAARVVFTPAPDEAGAFEGPFVGVSYAYVSGYDDPIHLVTPLDQTVFRTPDLDGRRARVAVLELGWRQGPFRMGYEDVMGEGSSNFNAGIFGVPSPAGGRLDLDQVGSWTLYTAYTLVGETPVWTRGGWQPHVIPEDGPLPVEVGLRYSNADIDRQLFDSGITTYDPSSQETRTFSAAASAFVHRDSRLTLQWVKVVADDDLSTLEGGNRASSWVLRWDQRF